MQIQTVVDDDVLWRCIHSQWISLDKTSWTVYVSREAFKDSSDGTPMSVIVASVAASLGHEPLHAAAKGRGHFLVGLSVRWLRLAGLTVEHLPLEAAAWHGGVRMGADDRVRLAVADHAWWIVPPPLKLRNPVRSVDTHHTAP